MVNPHYHIITYVMADNTTDGALSLTNIDANLLRIAKAPRSNWSATSRSRRQLPATPTALG